MHANTPKHTQTHSTPFAYSVLTIVSAFGVGRLADAEPGNDLIEQMVPLEPFPQLLDSVQGALPNLPPLPPWLACALIAQANLTRALQRCVRGAPGRLGARAVEITRPWVPQWGGVSRRTSLLARAL
jgi:hypothetical protein